MVPLIVDKTLGGVTCGGRTDGQPMLSLDAFAQEALTQLEGDKNEVFVGVSIETRQKGDALFLMMSRQAIQTQ